MSNADEDNMSEWDLESFTIELLELEGSSLPEETLRIRLIHPEDPDTTLDITEFRVTPDADGLLIEAMMPLRFPRGDFTSNAEVHDLNQTRWDWMLRKLQ